MRDAPHPVTENGPRLAIIASLLQGLRMLVVFDDFEQNLTPGGRAFLDPAIDEALARLADAADTGALSHNKLGDMAAAAGDLTAARASYRAALAIRERLAAIDPVNVQWQRDLEHVRRKLKELPEAG